MSTESAEPEKTQHHDVDDLLDRVEPPGDITLREMQWDSPKLSLDELARRQGVRFVKDVHEAAAPELFASDEEADEFIAWVRASRRADLA